MIGKMLRFMRITKGYKQTDLANKLNISDSTLAHYESEYRTVSMEKFNEIASLCDFDIIFINKSNHKQYKFDDMKQMTYDVRVKSKNTID